MTQLIQLDEEQHSVMSQHTETSKETTAQTNNQSTNESTKQGDDDSTDNHMEQEEIASTSTDRSEKRNALIEKVTHAMKKEILNNKK